MSRKSMRFFTENLQNELSYQKKFDNPRRSSTVEIKQNL